MGKGGRRIYLYLEMKGLAEVLPVPRPEADTRNSSLLVEPGQLVILQIWYFERGDCLPRLGEVLNIARPRINKLCYVIVYGQNKNNSAAAHALN